jgi:hypothetical protein
MTEGGVLPQLTRADQYRVPAAESFSLGLRDIRQRSKNTTPKKQRGCGCLLEAFDQALGVCHQYLALPEYAEWKLRNRQEPESS